MVDARVIPELRARPYRLPDGPKTAIDVLAAHESHRKKHPGYAEAQARMHMMTTLMLHVCSGTDGPPDSLVLPPHQPRQRPSLALLIASHIKDRGRLQRLQNCLRSAAEQRGGALTATFLSWSAEEDVRPAVCELLRRQTAAGLHTFEQQGALRQFEHYARLTDLAVERLGTDSWAIFADDDDLMHPDRSSAYADAIATAPEGVACVGAAWTARPVGAETIASTARIDVLVRSGRVVRTPDVDENGNRKKQMDSWDEYFNYGVRLQVQCMRVARPGARHEYGDATRGSSAHRMCICSRISPASLKHQLSPSC